MNRMPDAENWVALILCIAFVIWIVRIVEA